MRGVAKFLIAFAVAFVVLVGIKMLLFTVYTVEGQALAPTLVAGDRVVVNRWSYGLRVGGSGSLFDYGRLGRSAVERGDLVAFENPQDSAAHEVLICRCTGLPGDTIRVQGQTVVVPSLKDCADGDYYWMEAIGQGNPLDSRTFGFVPAERIIGRAITVVYSLDPDASFFESWRSYRFFLPL